MSSLGLSTPADGGSFARRIPAALPTWVNAKLGFGSLVGPPGGIEPGVWHSGGGPASSPPVEPPSPPGPPPPPLSGGEPAAVCPHPQPAPASPSAPSAPSPVIRNRFTVIPRSPENRCSLDAPLPVSRSEHVLHTA